MDWQPLAFGLLIVALTVWRLWPSRPPWKEKARSAAEAEKAEAYFKAMFPDLQPLFHPRKLIDFVTARQARPPRSGASEWADPPGFGAAVARLADDPGGKAREQVRLLDAAGTLLSEFFYEAQPAGGVLRLGQGKFTVDLSDASDPAVRYWHPEREFKWSQKRGWRFTTRVADQPFDSGDSGTRWSSDSGSSSSHGTAAAAGAAGLVAAGGAFAGAGASGGWEDGNRGAGSADPAGSADGGSTDGGGTAY